MPPSYAAPRSTPGAPEAIPGWVMGPAGNGSAVAPTPPTPMALARGGSAAPATQAETRCGHSRRETPQVVDGRRRDAPRPFRQATEKPGHSRRAGLRGCAVRWERAPGPGLVTVWRAA